jgi:crotonobetainyl-CoA:carnitine CoA-transferase CaiB-like acyl-CoA transferase
VLDLTRVIAGPVATRTLALYGANVLRIDSPSLPEISWQYLDTGQGKRSALLDLAQPDAAAILDDLLHSADVLVTGYRPGALDRFGLDPASIRSRAPHLITATVDAWGPSGPWSHRRGFDSIVQAASGIASLHSRNDAPGAMPAQALDHSAGYLLAASVMSALERRHLAGDIEHVGISLLSVAHLLIDARSDPPTVQNEPAATKSWQQCTTQLHLPNGESVHCARPAPTLRGQALDYAAYESGYGHARPVWSYA